MGERLRDPGIRLAGTRSTALFQLATELPAAALARTLGLDTTAAVTGSDPQPEAGPPAPPKSAAAPQHRRTADDQPHPSRGQ
ncbi:hypothetical protein [Streptomyces poonensis]|uniref:hypothetical protein n=1 Tax=Streptomyces poonensis TaxID=68255 RepID=UPI0016746DD5|nr:hypothetical protein [Streptomyces poonensis]